MKIEAKKQKRVTDKEFKSEAEPLEVNLYEAIESAPETQHKVSDPYIDKEREVFFDDNQLKKKVVVISEEDKNSDFNNIPKILELPIVPKFRSFSMDVNVVPIEKSSWSRSNSIDIDFLKKELPSTFLFKHENAQKRVDNENFKSNEEKLLSIRNSVHSIVLELGQSSDITLNEERLVGLESSCVTLTNFLLELMPKIMFGMCY